MTNGQRKITNLLNIKTLIAVLFLFAFWNHVTEAAINAKFNYQGKLMDNNNWVVSDGNYNLRLRLCTDSSCSTTPIWTETRCYSPDNGATCNGNGTDQRVPVTAGLFSVLAGSISSLDAIDANQTLFLDVSVGGTSTSPSWETLLPRKEIGSVMTSMLAKNSSNLTGSGKIDLDSSMTDSDAANINYNPTSGTHDALSLTYGTAGGTGTALNITQNGNGIGAMITNLGSNLSLRVNDESGNNDSTPFVIDNTGKVGIGTTDPNEKLDVQGRLFLAQTSEPSSTANRLYNVNGNLYWNGINITTGGFMPSGTLNGQTLRYDGSAWSPVSNLYNNGTNVGIGTTAPSSALEVNGTITATGGNSSNWNTAYSWGNHASQGYLTSSSLTGYAQLSGATFTGAVSATNLSGTNSGDNATNANYASDYRAANFVAGTNYLAPNGSAASLTNFPTLNQNTTGNATTATNLTGLSATITNLNSVTGLLGTAAFTASSAYATAAQGTLATNALPSASFTDAAVTGKLITGYTSGAGTVAATDTILQAIQKLNGNITANGNGTVTSVSTAAANNGVTATWSMASPTPALTIGLGNITPTTVNGLTLAIATSGFTIAGGTTSKTLTVSNTLAFAGTDGSTLNIGAGGTLGTAAYTASSAYAPAFTSGTANYFWATPNGSAGVPSLRALVAADIPTLNQNTTGNAGTVTNGVYTNASNTFSLINPLITAAESWIGPSAANGIYFKNGQVGIGTTNPGYALEANGTIASIASVARVNIIGSTSATLQLRNTGAVVDQRYSEIYDPGAGSIFFRTANDAYTLSASYMIVKRNTGSYTIDNVSFPFGNIGIGTTAPLANLHDTGTFRADGVAAFSANVGIGTTDPTSLLSIAESGASMMDFKTGNIANGPDIQFNASGLLAAQGNMILNFDSDNSGTGAFYIGKGADSNFSTKLFTILNNGNVGIGTMSPSEKLNVNGNVRIGSGLGSDLIINSNATPIVPVGGSTLASVFTNAGNAIGGFHLGFEIPANDINDGFYVTTDADQDGTPDTVAMKINALGNIGIGTTSPIAKLDLNNSTALSIGLRVAGSTGPSIFLPGSNADLAVPDAEAFQFGHWNNVTSTFTENMRINSAGNIGIGTTNPGYKLQVIGSTYTSVASYANQFLALASGNAGAPAFSFNGYPTTGMFSPAANQIGFSNAGIESMRIDSSGNVGIGTTNPTLPLHVFGTRNSPATSGTVPNGSAVIASNNGNSLYMGGYTASPYGFWLQASDYTDLSKTYPIIMNPNGGNVGIGTTAPGVALDVVGSIRSSALATANGIVYTNASGQLSTTSTGGAGTLCLVSSNGGTPTWGACSGSSATAWSSLTAPASALSLSMGTNTTAFSWATGTGTNNLFSLTTAATTNGTGALLNIQTGATSSTVLPLRVRAGNTEALMVNATGNVGIGTTNPSVSLQILSNVSGATNAKFQNNNASGYEGLNLINDSGIAASSFDHSNSTAAILPNSTWLGSINTEPLYFITNAGNSSYAPRMTIDSTGNIGIGTTAPSSLLHLYGSGAKITFTDSSFANRKMYLKTSNNGAENYITLGGRASLDTVDNDTLSVLGNGNVGIGTTNPGYKLEVATATANDQAVRGVNSATTGTNYGGVFSSMGSGATTNIGGFFSAIGATNNYGLIVNQGTVGIGTTGPLVKLHIQGAPVANRGTIEIDDSTAQAVGTGGMLTLGGKFTDVGAYTSAVGISAKKENATSNNYSFGMAFSTYLNGQANMLERMRIDSSGNVGIGTTGPTQLLTVYNGTTTGTYTTTGWIHSSDLRLKTNISTIANPLDKIMALNGVDFNWKTNPNGDRQIGLIAQDTMKVLPEVVVGNDQDGYGIAYGNLTALLIEGMKTQQTQINALTLNSPALLTKQLASLTQNLATLTTNVDVSTQKITNLENNQLSSSSQIELLSNKLGTLDTNTTSADSKLALLTKDVETNKNDIANLKDLLKTQDETKSQIDDLAKADIAHEDAMTTLSGRVDILEKENQAMLGFADALDINKDGSINLNLINGKLLAETVEAKSIVAGAFAVKTDTTEQKTIGQTIICQKDKVLNDNNSILSCQDAATGDKPSDGKSVFVPTSAISNNSKIFVTFEDNPGGYYWIEKVKDGDNFKGFNLKLSNEVQDSEVRANWWVVDEQ